MKMIFHHVRVKECDDTESNFTEYFIKLKFDTKKFLTVYKRYLEYFENPADFLSHHKKNHRIITVHGNGNCVGEKRKTLSDTQKYTKHLDVWSELMK